MRVLILALLGFIVLAATMPVTSLAQQTNSCGPPRCR